MSLKICQDIGQGEWTTVFDSQQQVPYSYSGREWIGYDNARSIQIKTQYAMSNNLAGVFIWTIEGDDRSGACGGGRWPLLNAIDSTLMAADNCKR